MTAHHAMHHAIRKLRPETAGGREPGSSGFFKPWGFDPEIQARLEETGAWDRRHLSHGRKRAETGEKLRGVGESRQKTIEESVAEWRAKHAILC